MPSLPAALPPGERTVGQLVAETIRAYGNDFWRILPLGVPLALADQLNVHERPAVQIVVLSVTTPLFAAAFIWACQRTLKARPTLVAFAVAVLIWLPFPVLRALFLLPGIAWLAFIGLAVPAAMVEKLGFRDALARGRQLGTADYVHALGSLAALVVVVGVAGNTLSALLHTQSDNGARAALFLSDLVLSPLLFAGGALLYVDQVARIGSRRPERRSSDADLHPSVEPDAAGSADTEVEP